MHNVARKFEIGQLATNPLFPEPNEFAQTLRKVCSLHAATASEGSCRLARVRLLQGDQKGPQVFVVDGRSLCLHLRAVCHELFRLRLLCPHGLCQGLSILCGSRHCLCSGESWSVRVDMCNLACGMFNIPQLHVQHAQEL